MKNLIYVLLAAFLAVSCKQTNKNAAESDNLREAQNQQANTLLKWNKWDKCDTMKAILKDINDGNVTFELDQERIEHRTNQAHMHTDTRKFWEYNVKVRGGNLIFYRKLDHQNRRGYFPFVVLNDTLDIGAVYSTQRLQNDHIHLKIDTVLFRVPAIKNSNGKPKGEYCMFIVTGVD